MKLNEVIVFSLFSLIFLVGVLGTVSASPGVTVTSPNGGQYWKGTNTVTWTASEVQPYYEFYVYAWKDGDSNQDYAVDISGLGYLARQTSWNSLGFSDGQYKVRVMLWNHNAASEVTEDLSNSLMTIDNTKPTATISDVSGSWTNADTITLGCSDATSGCSTTRWYYYDSDGVCSSSKADYTFSVVGTSIIVSSTHNDYLCLWVEDNAGNSQYTDTGSQLKVDATNPTAGLTASPIGLTNQNTVTYTPTCGDTGGSGLVSCTTFVKFNGGVPTSISTTQTAGQTYTMTTDGTYTFYTVAIDNASNSIQTSNYDVQRDMTEPTISITNAPTTTWNVGSSVNVLTSCNDAGATIKYYYSDVVVSCSTKNFDSDYVISNAATKSYVCAAAKDTAGNIGYSSMATFQISSTIQGAIDAASPGDIINVGAGTYTENLNINNEVILQGMSNPTIIGAHVVNANNVVLDGFVFNMSGSGTVITIDSSSSTINGVSVLNSVFNVVTSPSIAVYLGGGTPSYTVSNVGISSNTFNGPSDKVCNAFKIGGAYGSPLDVAIENFIFEDNQVNRCSNPVNLQDVDIDGITINNNVFRNTDGVVYVWAQAGTTPTGVLSNFVFTNNDVDSTNSYGLGISDSALNPIYTDINFGAGNRVNNNKFVGIVGAYGFKSVSILATLAIYKLNAEDNWWGHITGPGSIGPGDGSGVSTNVNFAPWWVTPTGGNDVTSPESHITLTGTQYSTSLTFDLPYVASDDYGLKRIRLYESGGYETYQSTLGYPLSYIGSFSRTVLGDGIYQYYTRAVDIRDTAFGGVEDAPLMEDVTIIVDTINPIVAINSATSPTKITTQTITGTFTEANINTITVNGVTATLGAGTYSANVPLTEGLNTITVVATDLAGNTGQNTSSIILDTQGPIVSHTQTVTGRAIGSSTEVTATVTDANGINNAVLYYSGNLNGTNSTPVVSGSSYTFIIPASTSKGTLTYYINATDNVGNLRKSSTYTITVNDMTWDLSSDWNLVSSPKTLTNSNKASLLGSATVWEYNAQAKTWVNPTTLNPGVGYWVDDNGVTQPGLDYAAQPGPGGAPGFDMATINLQQGWNLIGHMCTSSQNVTVAFPSNIYNDLFVLRYDESTDLFQIYATQDPTHREFNEMVPGEGYWVFVPQGNLAYTNIC